MKANIKINNSPIHSSRLYSFYIDQQFNQHHTFECRLYPAAGDTKPLIIMQKARPWLGSSILIDLGAGNQFNGLVNELSLSEKDKNNEQLIVLKGCSPTILLDTFEGHYESYSKLTLQKLIETVKDRIVDSKLKWKINISGTDVISYITQYKESYFAFLNRLSAMYGEFFFYDGKELHFGKPADAVTLDMSYPKDIQQWNLTMKVMPVNFKQYHYNYLKAENLNSISPDVSVGSPLTLFAYKKSKSVFTASSTSHAEAEVEDDRQFKSLQNNKNDAITSSLVKIEGKSTKSSLRIGCHATLSDTKTASPIGKFLITQIRHQLTPSGKYDNSFKGVYSDVKVLEVDSVTFPVAEQQIGHVTTNEDPQRLGRVKVKMLWQKEGTSTGWIRILSPYAGAKDRGILFIPLKKDEVVVDFHHGDPDRPFVAGSVYNKSRSPEIDPKRQSIKTAEGSELYFVSDGKNNRLGLQDINGNKVEIDTDTNSINIISKNTINIQSASMTIEGEEIEIRASKSLSVHANTVDLDIRKDFKTDIGGDYEINAGQIRETALGDFVCNAGNDLKHLAGEELLYQAENGDLSVSATENITFTGQRIN